ncbi:MULTISPECIES: dipeptide ABC transporter ATP-binding protein [Streptomyces]|uniref:Oligopeptide transport ATP-binding protein OppF n=1 Tax=Streptomyces venezuelae (strain ATCC 10712 / CBS 650.69 / DSM 40230 / JCM 4526 / NBRC 13096 / PD 04745) TaxID=953739 RepID=F2R1L8_STRVP|nr:ABC transporter ATP-binding protein [Streptomyces venezuelae]APE23759.1 ABC transporter ATP-binding protein [Streptomyces venezuelae]QES01131.1 ABC transporter ATP-binding protein [Streptomyces venezuelae ATCC 10712]CCA58109.1 Oligopeptide transport ATP-binding protein OppF [Streptomyces venezuelae ATCC 10712]
MTPIVEVTDLTVEFARSGDPVRAVDGLSFTLGEGRALALVGESGSGKSTVAAALLGLHRGTGAKVGGTVRVGGIDVATAGPGELRRLRGGVAAMVFQDPLSALDPYYAVGDQIAEVYRVHAGGSRRAARARAVEVLDRVGIPDAARRTRSRPHEFSGGMRQRALLAMALACEPRLLVADEPTTALDVTVQAQILDLLHELRRESGTALLLVTHDVGVAAESVDEVLVMQGGREVERGPVGEVLGAPAEPYTRRLLAAVPRLDGPVREAAPSSRPKGEPLLEVRDLRREFGRGRNSLTAVEGASLTVHAGETLGLVGESGSGKTTLGRMLVRLLDPTGGQLRYQGREIGTLTDRELRPYRRELQMVFQDPVASLNPRRSIGASIADPLRVAGERDETRIRSRVRELLDRVGLDPDRHEAYPHEFSGGQRQRVGIARALAADPRIVVCDEPVSALDVTTQAQVTALLAELQAELGLGLVFIAHDLAVVRQVSDRVAVMRAGRIVEQGTVAEVYGAPRDPYTRQLLAAVPSLDPALAAERRAVRAAERREGRQELAVA